MLVIMTTVNPTTKNLLSNKEHNFKEHSYKAGIISAFLLCFYIISFALITLTELYYFEKLLYLPNFKFIGMNEDTKKAESTPEKTNDSEKAPFIKGVEDFLDIFKDNKQENTFKALNKVFRMISPHPAWKIAGDICIASLCISAVLFAASQGYIKEDVKSLLALIVGAVVGSRFKSS
jgi:hypothetical protein